MNHREEALKHELFSRMNFSIQEHRFYCGHCQTLVMPPASQIFESGQRLRWSSCPSCQSLNVFIGSDQIHPIPSIRVDEAVPSKYAIRYQKASKILSICPDSSASAVRKCIELILEDEFGAKSEKLFDKIEEIKTKLSPELYEDFNRLRKMGNFGTHIHKNSKTGELLSIEKEEAEFALMLLNELFEECFIKPARKKKISEQFDEKMRSSRRNK